MKDPALRMDAVTLGYGERVVLRGASLSLREGELVGVIGPNGSGKTTLVRGATRVIAPSAGSVTLLGRPVGLYDRRELARNLAVIPQEGTPIFPFTVLETVLMGRAPWLRPFASIRFWNRPTLPRLPIMPRYPSWSLPIRYSSSC